MPRVTPWIVATLLGAPAGAQRVGGPPGSLPRVAPSAVAMSAERLRRIDGVVRNAIAAGGFPGAAVIVGRRGAIVYAHGFGTLDWTSLEDVEPERTLYDVASLTKVVATTTAAMILVDQGRLDLDAPVSRYLPTFQGSRKSRVTIRELLTHSSGLPAGRDLRRAGTVTGARGMVLRTALVRAPGARIEYSDLGADVLGFVIERVAGAPLDAVFRRLVRTPLHLSNTMFRPPAAVRARAASTGSGEAGVVHDANARALGGVAGHAGLFATASDLAVFAQMMLDHGRSGGVRLATESTVDRFTRRQAGWRALGWETCAGGGSCGRYMDSTAFGHTGFTGTSLWIDPRQDLFVIVLTNWVLPDPSGRTAPVAVLHDTQADVADLAELSVTDHGILRPMPRHLRSDLRIGWGVRAGASP